MLMFSFILLLLLLQHWNDEKLVWDPDAYEGIVTLRIPATEIWVPDVTLYDKYVVQL